jgi:hypothetical protein
MRVLDGTRIMSIGLEFAPALLAVLAAAVAFWAMWRLARRALGFGARRPEDAPARSGRSGARERREPVLGLPVGPSSPAVPDAADVLALKASIDALTRQIASLERTLVPLVEDAPASSAENGRRSNAPAKRPLPS